MNTNLLNIAKEVEALEKELELLFNLKDPTEIGADLSTITLESVVKRCQVISYSILDLHSSIKDDSQSGVNSSDLISTFLSAVLTKLLLKTVCSCNNNLQVLVPVINKVINRDTGIINDYNNLLGYLNTLVTTKNK